MNEQQLKRTIEKAKDACTRSGARLTEKRERVLQILLKSDRPLSAYELRDEYKKNSDKPIPTMSVYRILKFLEEEHLAHKVSSTSKYIACSEIDQGCNTELLQFLVCSKCQSTKEVSLSRRVFDELAKLSESAGYTMTGSQFELQCLCNDCAVAERNLAH